MKRTGKKIMELVEGRGEAYIFLANEEIGARFMKDAGAEGFVFGDGVSAADRKAGDIMLIGEDRRLCYVGYSGHMAFNTGKKNGKTVARIDYAKYVSGDADYFVSGAARKPQRDTRES